MPPSLCRAMAANPPVSRFWEPPGASGSGRRRLERFLLGFRAASWQHRYLDCGTLISERTLRSRHPMSRHRLIARKEPPVAGACMVGEVLG
jgi:hypothetical protein